MLCAIATADAPAIQKLLLFVQSTLFWSVWNSSFACFPAVRKLGSYLLTLPLPYPPDGKLQSHVLSICLCICLSSCGSWQLSQRQEAHPLLRAVGGSAAPALPQGAAASVHGGALLQALLQTRPPFLRAHLQR